MAKRFSVALFLLLGSLARLGALAAISAGENAADAAVCRVATPSYARATGSATHDTQNTIVLTKLDSSPPARDFSSTAGVNDAAGGSAQKGLSIQITGAGPSLMKRSPLIAGAGPSVTTASPLPAGVVGTPYTAVLKATGGTMPYMWSLVTGGLPPGLTLSNGGLIGGTPSAAGTFGFTVRVKDAGGESAQKGLSIQITGAGLSVTSVSSPPAGARR